MLGVIWTRIHSVPPFDNDKIFWRVMANTQAVRCEGLPFVNSARVNVVPPAFQVVDPRICKSAEESVFSVKPVAFPLESGPE